MGQLGAPVPSNQAKYFDLLARYYVLKRQHILAAHVLLRLAERHSTDVGDAPTLEQRLATSSSFSSPFFFLNDSEYWEREIINKKKEHK
jgi:hypothetical protein